MSTIRTDPVTGHKVIIASERADRPRSDRDGGLESDPDRCPFCRGNEEATPPRIASYPDRDDEPWDVRVVPNKFPALSNEVEWTDSDDGLHHHTSGVGAHEVIIEAPDHRVDLTDLDVDDLDVVLRAWQDRIRDLRGDQRLETALIFKNHGAAAGASLEYVHSQLVALPHVPEQLRAELEGARRHYDDHGSCIFCRLAERATEGSDRLVDANEHVAVYAPFASRFPFELQFTPRAHRSRFDEASGPTRRALAELLLEVVDGLERALDAPPYNAVLHTAPLQRGALDHFHWHLELIPTLSHVAGFEWGAGSHINSTPPERAAKHLRRLTSGTSEA